MSYPIRPNIPEPGTGANLAKGTNLRRLSYFSKELEQRALKRKKEAEKEEARILKSLKEVDKEAEAELALRRKELIDVGKNFSKTFLGLRFDVKNDVQISSVLKFNLEEKAVEQTQDFDNKCSKNKDPESDLFGYEFPLEVNKMRLESKESIVEFSVPLPRYYHITNGKIGGFYEEAADGTVVKTTPKLQYHRIPQIHFDNQHHITMKEYAFNMRVNHIAYLSDEFNHKVSKFQRYDMEIELSNILMKYQSYKPVNFSGVKKHLIVYCHDRIKMLECYLKFKFYLFDINQLAWMTDTVDDYVKLSYYAHTKHQWNVLNNYFKTLFKENFLIFKNRIILAQHPDQIPLEFRNKCNQLVFSFTDFNNVGLSKLDKFYKKCLDTITGNIYHISCIEDDFVALILQYAIESNVIR